MCDFYQIYCTLPDMARPISPVTTFIRTFPRDTPIAVVIAKAKAKGFTTTKSNVSRVRRDMSRSGKPAASAGPARPAAAPAPAAPKASAPVAPAKAGAPSGAQVSKSQFIRNQPFTLPAAAVVARGKAAGHSFDTALVYKVRGRVKGKPKASKASTASPAVVHAATPPPSPVRAPSNRPDVHAVEEILKAVAAEIGLPRALQVLESERARVRAVIGA
jgi:hypothetical protein